MLTDEKDPEESPLPGSSINACDFGLLKFTVFSYLEP